MRRSCWHWIRLIAMMNSLAVMGCQLLLPFSSKRTADASQPAHDASSSSDIIADTTAPPAGDSTRPVLDGSAKPGKYRVPIQIANPNRVLQGYQVHVTFDTASLIASGKMRTDCSDIRITDSQQVPLSHWLDSGCNSNATLLWVRMPSLPAESTTQAYLFYGNPSATSASDLEATGDNLINANFTSNLSGWTPYYSTTDAVVSWDNGGALLYQTGCGNAGLSQSNFALLGPTFSFDFKIQTNLTAHGAITVGGTEVVNAVLQKSPQQVTSGTSSTPIESEWKFDKAVLNFQLWPAGGTCSNSESNFWFTNVQLKVRQFASPEPTTSLGIESPVS